MQPQTSQLNDNASQTSSTVASSTSSPCPTCGVDLHAAYAQLDKARRKLELLQEKQEVDQELLKQDKRNSKRRLKAAKLAVANQQHEAEQATEEALRLQRKFASQSTMIDKEAKEAKERSESKIAELQERIRVLQNAQVLGHRVDIPDNLAEEVKRLEGKVAAQQEQIQSYEMEMLDMQREQNAPGDDSRCAHCEKMERQLQDVQAKLGHMQTAVRTQQRHLADVALQKDEAEELVEEQNEKIADLTIQLKTLKTEAPGPASGSQAMPPPATNSSLDEELRRQIKALKLENEALQSQLKRNRQQHPTSDRSTMPVEEGAPQDDVDTAICQLVLEHELPAPLLGVYTGLLHNETRLPHGTGTLRSDDGAVYDGGWCNGQRHGRMGVYATIEGDVYRGSWRNDKNDGAGVYVWSDGRVFQGSFLAGQRHGTSCVMTFPYGATYQGDYVDDKRSGEGVYKYADGRCYRGSYQDDRPHGYGVLTAADGAVLYDGQWELGEYVG